MQLTIIILPVHIQFHHAAQSAQLRPGQTAPLTAPGLDLTTGPATDVSTAYRAAQTCAWRISRHVGPQLASGAGHHKRRLPDTKTRNPTQQKQPDLSTKVTFLRPIVPKLAIRQEPLHEDSETTYRVHA